LKTAKMSERHARLKPEIDGNLLQNITEIWGAAKIAGNKRFIIVSQ